MAALTMLLTFTNVLMSPGVSGAEVDQRNVVHVA